MIVIEKNRINTHISKNIQTIFENCQKGTNYAVEK